MAFGRKLKKDNGYVIKILLLSLMMWSCFLFCSCYRVIDVAPQEKSVSENLPEGNSVGINKTTEASVSVNDIEDVEKLIEEEVASDFTVEEKEDDPYADKHVKITLKDDGFDVFTPSRACLPDYRYGPSMIYNDDGSIDAWFSAPGDGAREYDWITYRHSDDEGRTWSDETVAISPSPNSPDALSTCDPDVFYYEGYYYIGYTSTINKRADGLCNSVFLARSKKPGGPYEKWNGSKWGGDPAPLIYYDGIDIGWGCGEPAFVIVDNTIYVYSTKDSYSGVPDRVKVTEVRTADITKEDWPRRLKFQGYAIIRNDKSPEEEYQYRDSDSWDVAYIEESKKFVAVSTNRRFKSDSCLLYFESNDGIHFEKVSEINTNVISRCHNCGIMGDGYGHIKKDAPVMLGYAYAGKSGSNWGIWATRMVMADIDYTDEIDIEDEGKPNRALALSYREGISDSAPMMLSTDSLVYTKTAGTGAFNITYYWQDNYKNKHVIDESQITIIEYDPDILTVGEDNWISPKLPGISRVVIGYNGLWREICLCVLPMEGYTSNEIKEFYPVTARYDLSIIQPYVLKIRPMAVFSNLRMHELTGRELETYGVRFASEDENICQVRQDGTLVPVSVGDTVISVTTEAGLSYNVDIHITSVW
ncbi:MAG: glycoside hydrolase [Lachnospiraceae bacterium]|nr:glycoside hydrolase [Lachnospiraceae bacterium]